MPGCDDLIWLANGHSFQVLLDRYVGDGARAARARAGGRQGVGGARSGASAAATTSPPTSWSTRRSGSGAAPSTASSGASRPTASTCRSPTGLFDADLLPRHAPPRARPAAHGGRDGAGDRARAASWPGLNEGTRGIRAGAENPDQAAEKALGINEHVHTVWAYLSAFRGAGLAVRRLERAEGWPPVPYGGLLARIPKLGMSLGTFVHLTLAGYASVSIYARKRA